MRYAVLLISLAIAAWGQGTTNRAKPGDYPVQLELPGGTVAAEYLVRSIPGPDGIFTTREYLVVEVAFYPKGEHILAATNFTLRLNGKKEAIFSQPAPFVAAALKYDDWEHRPTMVGEAGVGDTGVILGRPRRDPRFPGDNSERRLPPPPRSPAPDHDGSPQAERKTGAEVATASALPEGPASKPVSGYVYFAYKGKTKSIKSLELAYKGPAGEGAAKLIP